MRIGFGESGRWGKLALLKLKDSVNMGAMLEKYINMFYTENEVEWSIYSSGDILIKVNISDVGQVGMVFEPEDDFACSKKDFDTRVAVMRKLGVRGSFDDK